MVQNIHRQEKMDFNKRILKEILILNSDEPATLAMFHYKII